jgi:hypothetical protein
VATSRPVPSCRIGWADGSGRAGLGHFAKKILDFCQNQLAIQPSLLHNFVKSLITFSKSTCNPTFPVQKKFINKTLSFRKFNPPSRFSLGNYFRKNLWILIKSNHKPFHPLVLHEQHYTYNLNTKTR